MYRLQSSQATQIRTYLGHSGPVMALSRYPSKKRQLVSRPGYYGRGVGYVLNEHNAFIMHTAVLWREGRDLQDLGSQHKSGADYSHQ
jgi:hypothetical protein